MFKKIIAASAIFAFFACSGKDNDDDFGDKTSSSSLGVNASSSSVESSSSSGGTTEIQTVEIASLNNKASEMLGTFPYGYTLKAGNPEDLTQYWNTSGPLLDENGEPVLDEDGEPVIIECSTVSQQSLPDSKCERSKTNAILQNTLTNQYSDLHYNVGRFRITGTIYYGVKLDRYNLTQAGDQAALGLNAGDGVNEGKTIGELQVSQLDNATAFIYKRNGSAHTFRAVSNNDDNFWYYEVPATTGADFPDMEIPVSGFKGMGSYAANEEEGTEDAPFDISKVTKFLWVVEYEAEAPEKNQGSLSVYSFKAVIGD